MPKLPTVTVADLKSWNPCWPPRRIQDLLDQYEDEPWTALDVLSYDILPRPLVSSYDRFWVISRPELMPESVARACALDAINSARRVVDVPQTIPRTIRNSAAVRALATMPARPSIRGRNQLRFACNLFHSCTRRRGYLRWLDNRIDTYLDSAEFAEDAMREAGHYSTARQVEEALLERLRKVLKRYAAR